MAETGEDEAFRSEVDIEGTLAMIEKSQQLAGHFPDEGALDLARRILEGEITEAEAYAELDEKFAQE